MIEILTLGRGTILREGQEIPGIGAQRQKIALLTYLAMEGGATRDQLVALFWPDREEEKARHALSQALYAVRSELQEDCLSVTGNFVSLSPEVCTVDAHDLEAAAQEGEWARVAEAYQGAFLEHFSLPGAPEFERWQSTTREALARIARRAFGRVIEEQMAAGSLPAALDTARRWATLEPLEDEAQHNLIAVLARSGDRSAALRHFEEYRAHLAAELEVEPLEDTVSLVEEIRAGQLPEFRSLSPALPGPESTEVAPPSREEVPLAADEVEPPEPDSETSVAEPTIESFLGILRRRLIFHVGFLYLGASWLAIQVADILIDRGILPDLIFVILLYLLAAGLPLALILAWVQEPRRGEERAEALLPGSFWPRWVRKVRPSHVLVTLSGLSVILLPMYAVLSQSGGGGSPTGPVVPRVAILYFDDNSEGRQLGYFADALTEQVATALVQGRALEVLSLNAVKPFRNEEFTLEASQSLGVDAVVEGAVMGTRDQVQVSLQLIDADGLTHIDATVVEGNVGEPFEIVEDLVDEIAGLLMNWLGTRIRMEERQAGTESALAWELVQRAKRWREDGSLLRASGDTSAAARSLQQADQFLESAEEEDPSYVVPIIERAWVAAEWARVGRVRQPYDPHWIRVGLEHLDRVLEEDRDNSDALEIQGILLDYLAAGSLDAGEADSIRVLAEEVLRRAVELDESRTAAWSRLSRMLALQGRLAESKVMAQRAYEADPYQLDARVVLFRLCNASLQLKVWTDVTRWCGEGRERFPDRVSFVSVELAALAGPEGPEADIDRAWELAEQHRALSDPHLREPLDGPVLMQVAAVLARAGEADSARAVIARGRAGPQSGNPDTDLQEANAQLRLGAVDSSLVLLGRYLRTAPAQRRVIAEDWWWDELQDDPRFRALVDTAGLSRPSS